MFLFVLLTELLEEFQHHELVQGALRILSQVLHQLHPSYDCISIILHTCLVVLKYMNQYPNLPHLCLPFNLGTRFERLCTKSEV